jgi:hypothetical protein
MSTPDAIKNTILPASKCEQSTVDITAWLRRQLLPSNNRRLKQRLINELREVRMEIESCCGKEEEYDASSNTRELDN